MKNSVEEARAFTKAGGAMCSLTFRNIMLRVGFASSAFGCSEVNHTSIESLRQQYGMGHPAPNSSVEKQILENIVIMELLLGLNFLPW